MQVAEDVEISALTYFWTSRKLTHIPFAQRRDVWLDQRWRDGDYSTIQSDETLYTACFLGLMLTFAGGLFIAFAPYEPDFLRSGLFMMCVGLPIALARVALICGARIWVRRHGARRVACSTPVAASSVSLLTVTSQLSGDKSSSKGSPFTLSPREK